MTLPGHITEFLHKIDNSGGRAFNLKGSSLALYLACKANPYVCVVDSDENATALIKDIEFYKTALSLGLPMPVLIHSDGSAYDNGQRADAVSRLFIDMTSSSAIVSADSLNTPLWPADDLEIMLLSMQRGMAIERQELERRLLELGYVRVPLVTEHGQYCARGFIFDIFPSTHPQPFRLEFFGDEIESIRLVDIETQLSTSVCNEFKILPSCGPHEGKPIYELYKDAQPIVSDEIDADTLPELGDNILHVSRYSIKGNGVDAGTLSFEGLGITYNERKGIRNLPFALNVVSKAHKVVIVSSSAGQAQRIKDVINDADIYPSLTDLNDIFQQEADICITVSGLSEGMFIDGLMVITEKELFGGRPSYKPHRKSSVLGLLARLDDLKDGDFVVHNDKGIGRFLGLVKQDHEGVIYEVLKIEYDGGDVLYVPVGSIEKIKKYHFEEGVLPALDSLRSRKWQNTKLRIKEKIKLMAERLIRLYAHRESEEGTAFSQDTAMHREFDSFFEYFETPDQISAIQEIKEDMQSNKPMDRLLCGDVGYGKTEVAMRAAFKAVYDGAQVAVLCPTTLLGEQHLRVFTKRFSGFPISIRSLSRFSTPEQRKDVLSKLGKGEIDIVIGTHALLKPGIEFHNLGLLIIDEEHRFGVAQKEKIKELKKHVDVLSLSATPIPRTLQMALSGIRGMSVIETPPEERLSVKSIVSVFNEDVVRDAVKHELNRGGQVFFVHNRISGLERYRKLLERLVPEARTGMAHGRTQGGELERIMLSFLNKDIDVFVSTAIVGSGLDIPTANTIIINDAHTMGLADLYQLKGRVGRSNIKAYAYFLIPGEDIITHDAMVRLQAIEELSYMGAGFRLAMKDLEIRGAGNLLGKEQSGNVRAVGLDLYMDMLQQSIAEIRGEPSGTKTYPEIKLDISAFIPDDYIDDPMLKLSAYRRIATSDAQSTIDELEAEFSDRYGALPPEASNLLQIRKFSIISQPMGISTIKRSGDYLQFTYNSGSGPDAEALLGIFGKNLRFLPDGFRIKIKGSALESLENTLNNLID